MDRPISDSEIKSRRNRRLMVWGGSIAAVVAVVWLTLGAMETSVKRSDLTFATPDRGTISVTVSGAGQVAPAYEEIITSPIASRIEEVFLTSGDSVVAGTPIMRLDLLSTEAELSRLADRIAMEEHEVHRQELNNASHLSDLRMQAEVKEMTLKRLEVELRNERYLDSIGSGTGDRVRQAELAVNTGRLELDQLRQLIDNETRVADAAVGVKQLERSIAARNLDEMCRTLDNARIVAPRRGTLTWINDHIGEQVSEGTRLAVISDLGHFKVKGTMPDAYASKVGVGARASVVIGKKELEGTLSNLTPLSENGVISFEVSLDQDADPVLRSGLKTDIYVQCGIVDETIRLPRGSYYSGPGSYKMFVADGDRLNVRDIELGDANHQWVEVRSGLREGETVVVSDLKDLLNNKTLKIK